ncbi:MAG: CheR family methyltransferase [Vulcanimicrobiota bacterium]
MKLNTTDFRLFRDFVYDLTGIYFEETKKYLLERRIERRMDELGAATVREYYYLLKADNRGSEVANLINAVTTNETYFFRNISHIKLLGEELLPGLIKQKRKEGKLNLKLWSAACSTGEEPYTLAINVLENIEDIHKWNVQILANDINRQVLNAARRGVYGKRSVKEVHSYYLQKYFTPKDRGYEVTRDLKQLVRFFHMNIIDEKQMKNIKDVDIIFCRNVLIYFDTKSRKKAVDLMYDSLTRGGYIFLGHSESMSRISTAYKLVKYKNGIIYKKE